MQWEYKVHTFRAKSQGFFMPQADLTEVSVEMAEFGRQGWELVDFNLPILHGFGRRHGVAVFKRAR